MPFYGTKDLVQLLLFTALVTHTVTAQIPPTFQHYSIADGLSNNYVSCIHKDKKGFLWIGTMEGLNRFDGYQFTQYKFNPADTAKSLTSNWVEKMYEDENGILWLGTRDGVSSLNPATGQIKRFYYKQTLHVQDILPVRGTADFWAATDKGLFVLHTATGKWEEQDIVYKKGILLTSIAEDKFGRLWLGTFFDGIIMYNPKQHVYKQFLLPSLTNQPGRANAIMGASIIDRDNNLWMVSWYSGLVRINIADYSLTKFIHDDKNPYSIGGNGGLDIKENSDGEICIAGISNGFFIYDPSSGRFENHLYDDKINFANGLNASAIYRDDNGVYWVGTEKGITKYDPDNTKIKTTSLLLHKNGDNAMEMAFNEVLSVLKQDDSLLWVGTRTGLYLVRQRDVFTNKALLLPPPYIKGAVNVLVRDKYGSIWAGCDGYFEEIKYDVKKHSYSLRKILLKTTGSSVVALYNDDLSLWMGTYGGGLYKYNLATEKLNYYLPSVGLRNPLGDNLIFSILPITNGRLLLATNNEGLCTFDTARNTFTDVMPGKKIRGNNADYSSILWLFRDSKNNIWITTQFAGLLKTNDSLQHFTQVTENDGLPSLRVDYLIEDSVHNLWFTSPGRLVLYNTDIFKIKVFTNASGLSGTNELGMLYTLDKNTMLLAEDNTLHVFHPNEFIGNKKPPGVYITGCKIFDHDIPITGTAPLTLQYNQNYFSFEYVGINYSHTELTRYEYMLVGLDKNWQYAGRTRTVSYANLSEGTYTFKVRACNSEGIWSAVPATLTIIIAPPFWHRWWFYTAVILLATAIGYLLYRIKLNQLKKEIGIRDKIASDLHDDVGSTLSSIRFFTNVAYDTAKETGGTAVEPMIKRIDEASEKILYSLDDIVWSVNPANDRMELLAARMTEFAAEMLEAKDIKLDLCIDPEINNIKLTLAKRHDFFLIYKEAINNLAKYSGADEAHISLKREKNKMVLIVTDNGQGFDLRTVERGNGLNNMQKRADKIKAQLSISSVPGNGTAIKLSCTPT